jgi:hypothetical protein
MKYPQGFEKSRGMRYNTFTHRKLTRMVYITTKKPTRSQKMVARIFSYAYYCGAYLFILTVRLRLVK